MLEREDLSAKVKKPLLAFLRMDRIAEAAKARDVISDLISLEKLQRVKAVRLWRSVFTHVSAWRVAGGNP